MELCEPALRRATPLTRLELDGARAVVVFLAPRAPVEVECVTAYDAAVVRGAPVDRDARMMCVKCCAILLCKKHPGKREQLGSGRCSWKI